MVDPVFVQRLKKVRGRAVGVFTAIKPTALFGRVWSVRTPVCVTFVLTVGAIWLACGWLFDEARSVLRGIVVLTLPALWVGYRVGAALGGRPAPPPPPPPPAEEPAPAAAK